MKRVCEEHIKSFYIAKEPPAGIPLKDVAQAFRDLQQKRETADYDSSYPWTKLNAESWLDKTSVAFDNWRKVRTEIETQDFLLYLFMPSLQKGSGRFDGKRVASTSQTRNSRLNHGPDGSFAGQPPLNGERQPKAQCRHVMFPSRDHRDRFAGSWQFPDIWRSESELLRRPRSHLCDRTRRKTRHSQSASPRF